MDEQEKGALRVRLTSTFRPGAPVDTQAFLAGRKDQLTDILNATWQPGRHVIVFGERGVGKTSVAKVIVQIKRQAGAHVLDSGTINCDESDDFTTLWLKVFGSFSVDIEDKPSTLAALLPDGEVAPDDVRYALSRISGETVLVLDEVDQLKDEKAKNLLAATIKNLSDHSTNTTLILVGIADTLDELIAEHKSIERALIQVRMPRMTREELEQIIDRGLQNVGMSIEESAKPLIPRFSLGLPYFTHSLGLYASLRAVDDDRLEINRRDVLEATISAVDKAHNILSVYHKATTSPQPNNLYADVLLACSLVTPDLVGFFSAADLAEGMSAIMGKPYYVPAYVRHLSEFCEQRRGPILQKIGESRKIRYRFVDPLMEPFIMLKALSDGKIDEHLNVIVTRASSAESIH
jgi:ABC-type dipeptide/oligopeptide/nickel transport system ATPase component